MKAVSSACHDGVSQTANLPAAPEPKRKRKVRINPYLLGLPGSGGPVTAPEAVDVLLFLLCGFENLDQSC